MSNPSQNAKPPWPPSVDGARRLHHLVDMTLAGFPRISVDPRVCGGRPVVAGTRVRVSDVLEMLAGGASPAEIVADFPI